MCVYGKRLKSCHCKIPYGFWHGHEKILVFWSPEAVTKYNNKPLKRGGKDSEELKDS